MSQPAPTLIQLPERPRYDTQGSLMPQDEGVSNASDNEYQHALEVIFEAQNSRRRKSSLVSSEIPNSAFSNKQKSTDCFVHALLESQKQHGGTGDAGLETIAEILASHKVAGRTDAHTNGERPVEVKGGHDEKSESVTSEQEDEEAWNELVEPHLVKSGLNAKDKLDDSKTTVSSNGQVDHNAVHSRLLTKNQLSEMAWGVRELSKRLGSVRLKLKVKTVFVLTKAHDESLIGNTREVTKWLLSPDRDVKYTVWVQEDLQDNKKFDAKGLLEDLKRGNDLEPEENGDRLLEKRLRYWKNDMCKTRPHSFDFVITLGGDGTVLYASWLFQRVVPPVLSFALGSLGFLTKFDYGEFEETLTRSFRDGVTISLRLRFEGTVMRSQPRKKSIENSEAKDEDTEDDRDLVAELSGEEKDDERTHRPDGTYEILNDIVVDRGPNPTMSAIEIFGDDEHFTSVQADGICVATPTGSTAYNLAAGGSLCHPENPVILVTAICAHTLSFRPIILPDTIVLRVGVPYDARTNCWASFDGRARVELRPGDYVTISASRYPFAFVMPQGRRSQGWVNSISGKLGWNTRQRQKSYKEWSK